MAYPSRWYTDLGGLHFQCTQCGKCCSRPGYIAVETGEARAIAARYRAGARPIDLHGALWTWDADAHQWYIQVEEGQHCPFLVDGACSIHDIKPRQCATYPFWPEILASSRTWKEEAHWCEGIVPDGELYTPSLIDLIEREQRLTWENLGPEPS